jgi:septal ring factor EnvC (AmiA/AmiB activator)
MKKRKEIKEEFERLEKEIEELDAKKEPTEDQKNRRRYLVPRMWALRWVLGESNTTKIAFNNIKDGTLAEVHLVDNSTLYGELKTTDREDVIQLENQYFGIVTLNKDEVVKIYHDYDIAGVVNV